MLQEAYLGNDEARFIVFPLQPAEGELSKYTVALQRKIYKLREAATACVASGRFTKCTAEYADLHAP